MKKPIIVCLCGSTKFKQAFIDANFRETIAGNIVLSVGWFSHANGNIYSLTDEEKQVVDKLHLRKIDLADEVLILNVDEYIGKSTANELRYAYQHSKYKKIRFLEPSQFDRIQLHEFVHKLGDYKNGQPTNNNRPSTF